MRDIFNWNRTTDNFFRYHSTRPDSDGNHTVVYIPRLGADNPPREKLDLIVSKMSAYDLCKKPFGEPVAEAIPPGTYGSQIKDVRKIGEHTIAIDLETKGLDIFSVPNVRREDVKTAMHSYLYGRDFKGHTPHSMYVRLDALEEKIKNLEWLMGLAYQALEKLIAWYYQVRGRKPNVPDQKV